ncbi:hypothetical protein P8625_10335 [Tenacibaculum tangerinum]|uniref:Lipocalin-like domain-containing protein n=1 Tax=Tenacibaculum tangerinum TaxID=3038772 RepID=A0ABY8L3N0_9FLAO|nr:hypothetical protein [Tenacibaculum tangerinum]WGH74495.1 hypothetical protein P8625_10335 [Tenacibaculum tangerinum]
MKTVKRIIASFILVTSVLSCSSDEDTTSANCGDVVNQQAQGNVQGFEYINKGGTYTELSNGEYNCAIFIQEPIGGSCFFPDFEPINEELIEVKILFGLKELKPQTITFSDTAEIGGTLENTLNFNAIINDKDTNTNYTDAELATCGTLEIIEIKDNTITGKIIAEGQKGSSINGNFTLDFCEF